MELLEQIWEVLRDDFTDTPDLPQLVRVAVRLAMAALLGGVLGFERERTGKPAGLRTHMLVSLGAAVFVLAPLDDGMELGDASRVIQGIITGIGFIGGGTILKLSQQAEVRGLTTAASIWLTAAIGITVGLGRLGFAILSVLFAWVILSLLQRFESHISDDFHDKKHVEQKHEVKHAVKKREGDQNNPQSQQDEDVHTPAE